MFNIIFVYNLFVSCFVSCCFVFFVMVRFYNPCYNGRCVGGNELGDIIIRCCCQFVNRINVHILPVHHPTPEEIHSEPKGNFQ